MLGTKELVIPPAHFVCRGYTVFTLSVRASVRACVRPSVTLCFLNNSKSVRASVRLSVRNALFPE